MNLNNMSGRRDQPRVGVGPIGHRPTPISIISGPAIASIPLRRALCDLRSPGRHPEGVAHYKGVVR